MPYSKERTDEIYELIKNVGQEETSRLLGLKMETLSRLMRFKNKYLKEEMPEEKFVASKLLEKIGNLYSQKDLQAIANGGRILPGIERVPIISFEGKHIKIGVITDTHIGHQKFSADRLFQAFEEFRKAGVDFVVHAGDVTEGMSHRPGHIYELDALGYDQQKMLAINVLSQWRDTPVYMIDGNHDRWFIKSNGAMIVKDICSVLDNYEFIGHDEGDISLKGWATMKLWHGEDTSSYALSYRVQKIIEAFTGGEKPSILIAGHTHKYVKIFERNIYAISAGCIEGQTSWMRGKRIAAHMGFSVVDLWVDKNGITKMGDIWYPFY